MPFTKGHTPWNKGTKGIKLSTVGSFMLGHYNPDFINTNSEKIAVEVYARYYKQRDGRNIEQWKITRRETFKEYGWDIVFFDETEVNTAQVLQKLNKGD